MVQHRSVQTETVSNVMIIHIVLAALHSASSPMKVMEGHFTAPNAPGTENAVDTTEHATATLICVKDVFMVLIARLTLQAIIIARIMNVMNAEITQNVHQGKSAGQMSVCNVDQIVIVTTTPTEVFVRATNVSNALRTKTVHKILRFA